jgi:Protein kinase domain
MTTLQERLGEALAPDYRLERELGRGGMGVVFLGRDVTLDRPVAIKIVRPDRATAVAAERFIREARVLASLRHPNLIPVHRAGESAGFLYYVMDYLEAETLAQRLARGPLPAGAAITVARDVLAALEAVHGRGIVHRDVKPGNIFLVDGHAVIGDLGVAKASGPGEPLTDEGKAMGSPGYMAPEQMAGRDVGPAADLYATAVVLYEALTGRAWSFAPAPALADWTGVPARLVRPLQRALAWRPRERYQGAAQFRAALGAAVRRSRRTAFRWGAVAVLAAVGLVGVFVRGPGLARYRPPAAVLRVYLPPFAVEPAAMRWLADSMPAAVARNLRGAPDLVPVVAAGPARKNPPGLALQGTAAVSDAGLLELTLRSDSAVGGLGPIRLTLAGPVAEWGRLADSLAYGLLLGVWSGEGGNLAAGLPLGALPTSRAGVIAWTKAERLFGHAQWTAAYQAYRDAIAVDSTCLLCRVRLTDVTRWVDQDQDAASIARYHQALGVFPPQYRQLIAASFAPPDRRFEMELDVTDRFRDFGLGWFIRADDIFHRGAFEGYSLADAYAAMRHATIVWPDFAPAWEHLAWLAITMGDRAVAATALDSLGRLGSGDDPFELSIRTLLDVAYRCRFAPPGEAEALMDGLLRDPSVATMQSLSAAPLYLLGFDAPRCAIFLGERFQRMARPDLAPAGLMAQLYAFLSLGQVDSALAAGARLRLATSLPDVELFLAQLPAALLLADSAAPAEIERRWPEVAGELRGYASAKPGLAARRAAWLLALLARRAGDTAAARGYAARLAGEGGLRPLATLVAADADASRGRLSAALAATEPLVALDSGWQAGDPFFRAMLHLERAQWHAADGDVAQAERDLRWHENNDLRVAGSAASSPEAAGVDWALGTLARWRSARLLDGPANAAAACGHYAAVRTAWRGGDPPFAARADTAAARLAALHCAEAR